MGIIWCHSAQLDRQQLVLGERVQPRDAGGDRRNLGFATFHVARASSGVTVLSFTDSSLFWVSGFSLFLRAVRILF